MNLLYNKINIMKERVSQITKCLIVLSASSVLFGCTKPIIEPQSFKGIIFHIDDNVANVMEGDKVFKTIDVSKDNHRFLGWSTTREKENIIIDNNEDIPYESVKEYFGDADVIDLYAIYADVLTLNFVLETTTTFTLDSELNNRENIPVVNDKDTATFEGWSLQVNSSNADLSKDVTSINYEEAAVLAKGKYVLSFYPVYYSTTSNFKLYEYSLADEMAEIHIETKNHIAIDDASLINPDEVKGSNGEVPVYNYVDATITIDHCENEYALDAVPGKVKVRGNYTSTYPKKPIRIKFSEKQKMLGLNNNAELKSWVLLANWKDTSLLRDASAFYLGNAIVESDGYYTSDFRFVKVYLNDAYNGVYLAVEQQQIDKKRVNIPESKNATDTYKTGYFLEFDGYYRNEPENQKFTISYNDIKINNNVGFTISNDIMNTEQFNFIKKATQNIWKVLYDACKNSHTNLASSPYHTIDDNGDYVVDNSITTAKQAIDKVIDTKSLVDMYLIHDILEDRDIGFSSFYFALDFSNTGNKKLTFTAPWDFDYATGNSTFENALRAKLNKNKLVQEGRMTSSWNSGKLNADTRLTKDDFTFTNKTAQYCKGTDNPWFEVVSDESWLWTNLYRRYTEAEEAGVFSSLLTMIDRISDKYAADFNENFAKWPDAFGVKLSQLQPDEITYFVNQRQAADYLKIWLEQRIEGYGTELKRKAA